MKKLLLILMLITGGLVGHGQKIADLPTATSLAATDLLIIDKTAATSGITIANFFGTIPSDIITGGSLRSLKTTEQLRLSYDAANYMTVTLLDDGHTTFTTVDPDGAEADINFVADGNVGIKTAAPSTALEVTGRVTASTGFTDGTFTVDGSGNFTGVADFTMENSALIDNAETDTVTITETVVQVVGTFNLIEFKSPTNPVLTMDSNGDADTLATADIGDIAIDHSGGMTWVSTGGTQTIGTGGTFERLNEGAIAYTANHLHDFTHSDGRLTYTGTNTKHFCVAAFPNIESDEASARVQIRIALNGTTIADTDEA
ncbi:hypothetical protein LCGC14_1425220 [marine sediment metagenome]|uniref:Uncharacterized protein n=1 Tax=marine sediment metagenome TaxID=412755 RepID=A0A0F9MRY3_9ZZZZ